MTRLCAWCCRLLGQIAPLEDASVTHGLCPECYAKLLATPESDETPQHSSASRMLSVEVAE